MRLPSPVGRWASLHVDWWRFFSRHSNHSRNDRFNLAFFAAASLVDDAILWPCMLQPKTKSAATDTQRYAHNVSSLSSKNYADISVSVPRAALFTNGKRFRL